MTTSWAKMDIQRYDGAEEITCPRGCTFPAFNAVFTETQPKSMAGPRDGYYSCPGCGAKLEE